MSLDAGSSPSTFAEPVRGSDRRLAAKEHAAAKNRSANHRRVNVEMQSGRSLAMTSMRRSSWGPALSH